ncbi:centriolin, partial [Bombina bombina]|uniref:centriolin n=1 Tax=Bombina bombina TaxID=8345 RepID=UPI00235ACB14
QAKLNELRQEIRHAEQQILIATEELKGLEDAVAQKKISEAEKEKLREQLSRKIQLLNQLRKEAEELERQMERQRAEMDKKQEEIEDLETYLNSLNPQDPRHSHVKAQKAGKEQQLDMMDRQYKQLEGRLDEMLSRIAKETEEIKDLEQQLTDGQIAANEALKRDLEAIISGLQEYLESVKGQAKQAHDECRELKAERDTLLQRLAELEEERNQLEIVAMDAENMRKEIADLEQSLQEQQEVNESLRQAQGDLSEYEAELEAQLKERDVEAKQLKEELERRKRLSHMENSALQAELEKDRQALENAVTKAQLLEEKEKESKQLLSQLKQLQGENAYLNEEIHNLQNQLDQVADSMIHPEQITTRIGELKRKLQTGVGEIRCNSPADVLGQNLADLQKQINDILGKAQDEKREGQERQRKLQEELATLQGKAREMPEDYKRACNKAAEARIQSEKRQLEGKVRQQENELRRLNDQLKNMEEIQGLADQQLLEADEEREKLLTELQDLENKRKMEEDQAQAQVFNLEKELKELKRAVGLSDKMATSELSNAKDQLKSLHGTVIKLNEERATEMQEAANFFSQSARASRNLSKAEAEIELLQNILKEREKQLQEEMRHVHAGKTTSGLQQLEIDRLNHTLRKQQAEIERLKHLLDHARNDNIGEMENLLDEIASLRHALGHQNDYITSRDDPFRRRGYWYYVPSPSSASHCDSLSTKDSGVGLQYPLTSSPARHRCGQTRHPKKEKPVPSAMGRWVYSPLRHGLHRCHSSEDGEDCESEHETHAPPTYHFVPPPGSVIYTVLPDGAPVPQGTVIYGPPPPANGRAVAPGTVIYGPPPVGTQIAYGPPPPHFTIPIIPTGVLHCNVPAHHELENEITRLEDIIDHLKLRRQKEKMAKERLQEDINDLEHQKEAYKKEMEELRRSTQKRKRKEFIDGQLDSLITELELEKSLQHHNEIVDEIECIEKTLLKRRAELREADRLLIEAENELQNSREKTKEMIEKYNAAKENLSRSESDAEELERRAHETATQLVKADQQLRLLQANVKDLELHRAEQEKILKEINSVVSSRDAEFQSLNHQIDKMNDNFQKIQADIQVAEGKENHYLQTLREAEDIFQEKKIALERLNNQLIEQQQDAVELDRLLGQKKEELNLLEDHIDQKKAELKEALRDGELNVADRRKEIREVRSLLEDLSVQKGELNAQLNEKKAQLIILKQQVAHEEENLQKVAAQISKQKSELKHVLQMLQLENNELQGAKLQHDQKINELEETQSMLLEGKLELENLQRASQRLHGGVECQRQILERDHQEIELLMSQMHTLQQSMESLNGEKKFLEETNQDLEKKLTQAKKELAAAEGCKNTATGNTERLTSDIKVLQKETEQLNNQKQSVKEEMSAQQQILQGKSSPKMPVKAKDKKAKAAEFGLDTSVEPVTNLMDSHSLFSQLSELFSPQFDLIRKELGSISSEITALSVEVRQFAHRMQEAENRISDLEDQVSTQENIISQQDIKITSLQGRLDDLEDRARRNNIRIVGLPEEAEFEDLLKFASVTLPQKLGVPQSMLPIIIERAHRVGVKKNVGTGHSRSRMCICKVLNFQDKIEMMKLFKKLHEPLMFGNSKVLLFQDFSVETSTKRRIMAPLCTQIIDKGINARMVYPAKIIVEYRGARLVFTEVGEVKEFLKDK